LVINTGSSDVTVTFKNSDVGVSTDDVNIYNIWDQKQMGKATSQITTPSIKSHDSVFYRLTPVKAETQ